MERGSQPDGTGHFRGFRVARAGGFRVRPWWVVLGLVGAIVGGYFYFSQRADDPVERGFPNYMQNVEQ